MRCIRCMREIEENTQVCDFCGFPQDTPPEYPDALAPGTELRNRFLLGKELGRGGFGITYVGYDKYLDCKVAIKEYYPQDLAARLPGEVKLFWRNSQLRDAGCQNVIREAQKMHRLGVLPFAVHVMDVFYENNTAYIAMDYVEGITLKQFLLRHGVLTPEKCLELMTPIMNTMIQMHEAGIIHRDISPDNIMIQPDLKPRILDLGAAKDIQMQSGHTILVARNGFSPKEQYQTEGDIGTWTDVYALCATMFYALTGKVPPAAMDRSDGDDQLPFGNACRLPEHLRTVIQEGMRVKVERRIQNMQELKRRLMEPSPGPDPVPVTDPRPDPVLIADPRPTPVPAPNPAPSPVEEKNRGFLPALMALFGRKGPAAQKKSIPVKNKERKPVKVFISDLTAPTVYTDPNATVCGGYSDEEETVLFDEEPAAARATITQNSTGKSVEVTKCCFLLGRLANGAASAADCMIEDSTKHISRRHAAILFNGESYYIQDISGKNTTLLNGIRLQNGTMTDNSGIFPVAYPLYDGDCIQLADEKLTFHTGGGL